MLPSPLITIHAILKQYTLLQFHPFLGYMRPLLCIPALYYHNFQRNEANFMQARAIPCSNNPARIKEEG